MGRTRLKMAATLTVVVLALTGFQTSSSGGGKGGGKSKSSGKGGGCSSDKKDNDDYSGSGSSGGYDDSSGGSGGGSGYTAEPTATATATYGPGVDVLVVDCVKPEQKKRKGKPARKADTTATLRIVNEGLYSTTDSYRVTLEFRDASGLAVDRAVTTVTVGAGERKDFDVRMTKPKLVGKVRKCVVAEATEVVAPTASGTPSPAS
ncbi:hypothetical protein [Streptomyces roseolus]|uniref:hypothetical protein n=1 Tax=Streptomyces roseolus TaxID=67358 RepID=UPI0036667433